MSLPRQLQFELFAYLLTFLAVRFGLPEFLIVSWASVSHQVGSVAFLDASSIEQWTRDNSYGIQAFALILAHLAASYMRLATTPTQRALSFFKNLGIDVGSKTPRGVAGPLNTLSKGILAGFSVASLGLLIAKFSGLSKLEWPDLSITEMLGLIPQTIFQILFFSLWVFMFERNRSYLRSLLQGETLVRTLFTVFSQAFLLWDLLSASGLFWDRIFSSALCLLIASAYSLWLEDAEKSSLLASQKRFFRVTMFASLWIALLFIYGVPFGNSRALSIGSVVEGPASYYVSKLSQDGVLGHVGFVLCLTTAINLLIHRVCRRNVSRA